MPSVRSLTPIVYTTDLDACVAFYRLLGFEPALRGDDGDWRWAYGRCGTLSLLLAAGADRLPTAGPVQLYCQTDDVEELQQALIEAGATVEHLGYPDHAPGGELRVLDPDDHAVMVAQTTGAPTRVQADGDTDTQGSILQRAAQAVRRRGRTGLACQVGEPGGAHCRQPGEVKLADTWGDSVWSCLGHADDVLFSVRGAYIATEDAEGLARFLARRRTLK